MKLLIYSQKLSKAAFDLSTKNLNKLEFDVMKNDLLHINSVYDKEASLFDKAAKDPKYRKKMKHETGLLSDMIIGMRRGSKFNPVENKASILANVKERNQQRKKRQTIDSLTEELKKKYLEKAAWMSRNKLIPSNTQNSGILSTRSYCNKTTTRGSHAVKSMSDDLGNVHMNSQLEHSTKQKSNQKFVIKNNKSTRGGQLISMQNHLKNIKGIYSFKEVYPSQEEPSHVFTTNLTLNNFVIRDFLIGKNADPADNAEQKKKVATQSYTAILNYKKKLMPNANNQEITEERDKHADIDNSSHIEDDELIKIKEEQERQFASKAQEKARKRIEMFENLSEDEYEPIEKLTAAQLISEKNLRRVRKVIELTRGKVNIDEDDLGMDFGGRYKEEMRMNNNELMMMLNKLGPQKFVKKKFKRNTVERFNVVNGKYF